jgi:hypothetical protein
MTKPVYSHLEYDFLQPSGYSELAVTLTQEGANKIADLLVETRRFLDLISTQARSLFILESLLDLGLPNGYQYVLTNQLSEEITPISLWRRIQSSDNRIILSDNAQEDTQGHLIGNYKDYTSLVERTRLWAFSCEDATRIAMTLITRGKIVIATI